MVKNNKEKVYKGRRGEIMHLWSAKKLRFKMSTLDFLRANKNLQRNAQHKAGKHSGGAKLENI